MNALKSCCLAEARKSLKRPRDVATCDECGSLLLAYGNTRDFESTIEELTRGTLETGRTSQFSLENGGVGLGTINARIPRALTAEIENVRADIIAGKIAITSSSA